MRHFLLLMLLFFYSSFLLSPASFCSLPDLCLILLRPISVVQILAQCCFQHTRRHPSALDTQTDRFLIYFILQIFTSLSGNSFPDIKLQYSNRCTAYACHRDILYSVLARGAFLFF